MLSDTPDFDLDDLLAESVKEAQDAKLLKQGKNKLSSVWLKGRERDELRASVLEAQSRQEWTPTAAVAYFHEQLCLSCGTRHTHFAGFFQEQTHRRYLQTFRCVPAIDSTMLQGLPKKSKMAQYEADLCSACAQSSGWPALKTLTSPEEELPHGTWKAHQNRQKCSDEY